MQRKRQPGCLAYLLSALAILGAIIGWVEFFIKPIQAKAKAGSWHVAEVIGDLLKPVPEAYGWFGAGYIFILSAAFLAACAAIVIMRPIRWLLDYLDVSEAHVSVLRSDIKIKMLNPSMTRSQTTREQLIHANAPGVTAYQMSLRPLNGRMDEGSITVNSALDDQQITSELIKLSSGNGYEVIETFAVELPQNYWATYLPDRIVEMLWRNGLAFKKAVIERKGSAKEEDEYNADNPYYELHCIRYPVSKITITVEFFEETAPLGDHIVAWLITSNAAQKLDLLPDDSEPGKKSYTVHRKALTQDQRLRIQWKNDRLRAWTANQPPQIAPSAT